MSIVEIQRLPETAERYIVALRAGVDLLVDVLGRFWRVRYRWRAVGDRVRVGKVAHLVKCTRCRDGVGGLAWLLLTALA
jgi:hypothetical protein